MTEDNVLDRRLGELVGQSLANFRTGEFSLGQLVDALDLVWNELEPSELRDAFRGHWWTLEQVYAVAIDRGQLDALPADAVANIDEALAGIEALLETSE